MRYPKMRVATSPDTAGSEAPWTGLPVSAWIGLVYIAATPLENVTSPIISPLQLLGLAFFGAWLLDLFSGHTRFDTPILPFVPFVVFAGWSGMTILWSWAPEASIAVTVTNAALTVSLLAIATTFGGRIRLPVVSLAIGATATAAYVLVFGVYDSQLQAQIEGVDQNITAFGIAVGLSAAVYLAMTSTERLPRLVWSLCIALDVAAILRVGSRTGLVAAIGIALVFVVFNLKSFRGFVLALSSIGAGILVFILLRDVGLIPPRILAFLEEPVATDNREEITAAFLAFRSLWEGVGIGAGADAAFLGSVAGSARNIHSGFWAIWIHYGIVGIAIWICMLVSIIVGLSKTKETKFFLLVGVPVVAFMYSLGPMRSNLLWAVFGLALAGYTVSTLGNTPGSSKNDAGDARTQPEPGLPSKQTDANTVNATTGDGRLSG